ncbi:hypothetical protein BDQ12DRAFT_669854 [Crucibulum laeve]|uniref:BTB domain-containing protein n=1 Tax=Crucibulum laeve TaxID=68775 RepID=A0A5C3LLA8_9AGAR|nr:hypothetical protein BDQ12DRAFT_669854 [Crucibulum laeve]
MELNNLTISSENTIDLHYDKDYYRKDGDCVILVDHTLFRVHRYLLASDHSAFADMFDIGDEGTLCTLEGDCDTNPLVLHDTIEEFRALCWIYYALPMEIQQQNRHSDVQYVLPLLSIAHKYHFVTTEQWALEILKKHLEGDYDPRLGKSYLWTCPVEYLEYTATVCQRCFPLEDMQKLIEPFWVERISKNSSGAILHKALSLGERLGMQEFQSRLYYQEIIRIEQCIGWCQSWGNDTSSIIDDSRISSFISAALSPKEAERIILGFHMLSEIEQNLLRPNPGLPRTETCGIDDHRGCIEMWDRYWKQGLEEVLFLKISDTLSASQGLFASLEFFRKSDVSSGFPDCGNLITSSMQNQGCRRVAEKIVPKMKADIQRDLPNMFLQLLDQYMNRKLSQ